MSDLKKTVGIVGKVIIDKVMDTNPITSVINSTVNEMQKQKEKEEILNKIDNISTSDIQVDMPTAIVLSLDTELTDEEQADLESCLYELEIDDVEDFSFTENSISVNFFEALEKDYIEEYIISNIKSELSERYINITTKKFI